TASPQPQQCAPAPATASDAEAGPPPVALSLAAASVIHHGRHQSALAGISLQMNEGERVAIIGASGAGKSTLLALAAGELQPSTGLVTAMPATWLTQRTELFQDSVADNLRLAAPEADTASQWQALRAAGLDTTVRGFSQGLETPLGEGGLGLSGGQARRLALARLLLHPARFWLLDEPTEGLDQATAADVLARLARHADGRTVLIATHKRSEAALADRVLLVERGRLRADLRRGTPAFARALAALRQH
ncbi:MAG: ATP-binding cassette domain-containing protein, partial [Burkholderiaceae bacterium]|nr:ATP-binding cassette domain-containing protein [Burkholderiaceae bacterium]